MVARTFKEILKNIPVAKTFFEILKYNHNHDEKGRFSSGKGSKKSKDTPLVNYKDISAQGVNKFITRNFRNKQALNNHWKNGRTHRDEYEKEGIVTADHYVKRALELLESPCNENILGFKTDGNKLVRYDVKKNDFAVGNPGRGIYSMFKPELGIEYFIGKSKEKGVITDD